MTERTAETARIERLFMFAFVPALIFMIASLYVRVTSDPDPLWSEFATPIFLALVGARAIAVPGSPEASKTKRAIGFVLILFSAILLVLSISNSQGA